jgi:hypothetical protein
MEPVASEEAPEAAAQASTSALLAGVVLLTGTIVLLWYAPDSYELLKALHTRRRCSRRSGSASRSSRRAASAGAASGSTFALAGWLVAASVGVGFVGPELGRIDRAAQRSGPASAEVGRRVPRLFTIFRFDTALLILIVLDMTAKPSF